MRNYVKTGVAIILILASAMWSYGKYKSTRLGAVANNGFDGEVPELSEQARDKMRQAWEKRPPRTEQGPPSAEEREKMEKMRETFEKELPAADREAMKKAKTERERSIATTKAALSPEDQKALEQKMRGRRGGGRRGGGDRPGGPGGPGGMGGPGGPR